MAFVLFYLTHMMIYGESIGFETGKMKNSFAYFHVLGLFIPKKHDLTKNKFRQSGAGVR
jgi:hypothetical protein